MQMGFSISYYSERLKAMTQTEKCAIGSDAIFQYVRRMQIAIIGYK